MGAPAVEPDRRSERDEDPGWDLLARAVAGDGEAFERLVLAFETRIVGLCGRFLGDREEARDAAQDVFLKVYRKGGSFKAGGKVYTLLYRVAVNHCLNRLRRRKLARFLSLEAERSGEEDAVAFDPMDEAPDPAQALETRRRWRATRRAIDALPTSQRAVLILAKFEGLSYRQIAEVLDISLGAVESRLFRAMRRLETAREREG